MRLKKAIASALLAALLLTAAGCQIDKARQVVVYTSVDQIYAEPILQEFESSTGIQVLPVYDIEASKSTGLANRLLAEQAQPKCDVFWNGEFAQTMALDEAGVFEAYTPEALGQRADIFMEAGDKWVGFGGRSRVLLINTERLGNRALPDSLEVFTDNGWAGAELAMAMPLFGTAQTHGAALFALMGEPAAAEFYQAVKAKGTQIVDGNSVVRDMVVDGRATVGLTDTDDALGAVRGGAPVKIVFPDQGEGQQGTLVVPNTLSLVKGGPNAENGKVLIAYLLSDAVKSRLEQADYFMTEDGAKAVQRLPVTYGDIRGQVEGSKQKLGEIFVK